MSARPARRLVWLLALVPLVALAQAPKPGFWDVEKISQSQGPSISLRRDANTIARTVPSASMRRLLAIKQRIEKEAGFTATLAVTDMAMPHPNAFATRTEKGSFVAVNFAMLDMLGEDDDALAAVVGHEYAHIALNHRDARREREGARQGISAVLGLALGLAGVPMAGTLSNAGTSLVSRAFSRDEERDADEKGMRYAAAAGFAVEGGIRAWEQMSKRGGGAPLAFLSTHPASEERIERMRALAATLPRAVPVAAGPQAAERHVLRNVEFEQRYGDIVVVRVPDGAQTTLQPGDRIVSCSSLAGSRAVDRLVEVDACRVADSPGTVSFSIRRGDAALEAELR